MFKVTQHVIWKFQLSAPYWQYWEIQRGKQPLPSEADLDKHQLSHVKPAVDQKTSAGLTNTIFAQEVSAKVYTLFHSISQ